MRFNEGGGMADMLQQAMAAQGQRDPQGDAFVMTGQYTSVVQQDEDGREYVMYDHPDMEEPVKVYGNWNEYAVSQDEKGMMMIADEDYPIMQNEEGEYVLNEEKHEDAMSAAEERQGGQRLAREAASESTQGASRIENLLEKLQDAKGPRPMPGYGYGGKMDYEKGGKFPDLNKDGKITMADILKGRGVKGSYGMGGKVKRFKY